MCMSSPKSPKVVPPPPPPPPPAPADQGASQDQLAPKMRKTVDAKKRGVQALRQDLTIPRTSNVGRGNGLQIPT